MEDKNWIKYVIGGALFFVGIGLLFLEQTKLFAPVFIGISIGKIL